MQYIYVYKKQKALIRIILKIGIVAANIQKELK